MQFKYEPGWASPVPVPSKLNNYVVDAMRDETLATADYQIVASRLRDAGFPGHAAVFEEVAREEISHLGEFWLVLLSLNEHSGDFLKGVLEACEHVRTPIASRVCSLLRNQYK